MNSETKLNLNKFACKLLTRSSNILEEAKTDNVLYIQKITTALILRELANAILDTLDETSPR